MKKILITALVALGCLPLMATKYNLGNTGSSLKSFEVTCATTATALTSVANETYTQIACAAFDSTEVYFGGSDVTTANGFPICTDASACGSNLISLAANNGYCRVASGTKAIRCLVVVE